MKEGNFNLIMLIFNIIFLLLSPVVWMMGVMSIMGTASGQGPMFLLEVAIYMLMGYPVVAIVSFILSIIFLTKKNRRMARQFTFLPLIDIVLAFLTIILHFSFGGY